MGLYQFRRMPLPLEPLHQQLMDMQDLPWVAVYHALRISTMF